MTRSKQSTTPGVVKHDRHLQRNGFMDPRGMVKKDGAGQHNWGRPGDDEFSADYDEHDTYEEQEIGRDNTNAADTSRIASKLKVVKADEFEALQNVSNTNEIRSTN